MMGLRRIVEENESYREPMARRVDKMVTAMQRGPVLSAESYPNECWTLDNVNALAAVKIADVLDGTDHSSFFQLR